MPTTTPHAAIAHRCTEDTCDATSNKAYRVTHHDGSIDIVEYCDDCAEGARADMNGTTRHIVAVSELNRWRTLDEIAATGSYDDEEQRRLLADRIERLRMDLDLAREHDWTSRISAISAQIDRIASKLYAGRTIDLEQLVDDAARGEDQ